MKLPARISSYRLGWSTLIFVAVLVLQLVNLSRLSQSPFLLPSHGDMFFYNDWAQRILHGAATQQLAFYGLPGYAYLLALIYHLFGYNPFLPGFIQAGLGAATSVLICLLTLWILRSRSDDGATPKFAHRFFATGAAFAWAFFVPAQAYSIVLMPTIWFVFIFWSIVWWITRYPNPPRIIECLTLGLIIGMTATAVANILLLIPLVLAALVLKPSPRRSRRWQNLSRAAALLFVGIGIGTAPCWIHNYFVARDPVFLSAHSGINFWIGNNPAANGYPRFPPGLRAGQSAMLQDSINQAESAAGHTLKNAEVSAYWSAKTKAYISSNFLDWLRLLCLKLRNFWNIFQYDDLSVITNLREQGVIFPGCYFGLIATFAIPGFCLAIRHSPASRWTIAAITLAMIGLLPVFVTERYRLVAVPGLIILACYGLSELWRSTVSGLLRITATYLVVLAASVFFVSLPNRQPSLWALDAYNAGWQALESGNFDLAERKLGTAYAYVPDNTETLFALGNLRLAEQKSDSAVSFYHAVLSVDSHHKGALNNLGVIALNGNSYDDAERWLGRAEQTDPNDAKTHYLLAKTFEAKGERDRARSEIDTAIRLKPDQPEFVQLNQQIGRDQ